jgi:hypothetical protein
MGLIRKAPHLIVDSVAMNFQSAHWTVFVREDDMAVAGGTYLCVPVNDVDEAGIYMDAIEEVRRPTPAETEGKS